ncbi:DUF2956 domain-containing protein [Corallincola platygyrae]|uniref:DUF2956 domain-containing protein n=1 Tax=Corallincola platygyrae TaxID=1193278 RepID=A0ABW4XI41_9GAMM
MAKYKKSAPSPETVNEAESIAKATQRPGQTKEQTKLIAQGIQKGIEQYKKQHKAKQRERDKQQKRQKRAAETASSEVDEVTVSNGSATSKLPWLLLIASWLGFAAYLLFVGNLS